MFLVLIGAIIFLPVIAGLMALRSSLISPSAGFNLSEVFRVTSKNTGKNLTMFTLTIVVTSVLCIIIGMIFSAIVDSVLTGIINKNAMMLSSNMSITGMNKSNLYSKYFSSISYLYVIAAYIISFVACIASQIIVRAQGYFVASFIPEWLIEKPKVKSNINKTKTQTNFNNFNNKSNSFTNSSEQVNRKVSDAHKSVYAQNISKDKNFGYKNQQTKSINSDSKKININNLSKSVKLVAAPGHEFEFTEFPATVGSSKNATLNIGGDENLDDIHFTICLNKESKICIKDN